MRVRRFAGPEIYARTMAPVRIAHVTDQHVGRVTPFAIQREAQTLVNAEKPDLVLVTGDFVCHSQRYLDQLTYLMEGFAAPVVAVLGNHDYWAGADEVCLALKRAGVEVLRNQNTTITVRGQRLQLVGVDDAYTGHARCDRAVAGLRRDLPSLALSHIAEEADRLWSYGIPLVLSGHTHGGQIAPFGLLVSLVQPAVKGLHRFGDTWLYVSRGTGTWGPPMRLGNPAEITLVTLEGA